MVMSDSRLRIRVELILFSGALLKCDLIYGVLGRSESLIFHHLLQGSLLM